MAKRFQVITPLQMSCVDDIDEAYAIIDYYFSLPGPHARVSIDIYDAVRGDEGKTDRHGDNPCVQPSPPCYAWG